METIAWRNVFDQSRQDRGAGHSADRDSSSPIRWGPSLPRSFPLGDMPIGLVSTPCSGPQGERAAGKRRLTGGFRWTNRDRRPDCSRFRKGEE